MILATNEEHTQYIERAEAWLRDPKGGASMFASNRIVAKGAVAEFLANQDGKTLYLKVFRAEKK